MRDYVVADSNVFVDVVVFHVFWLVCSGSVALLGLLASLGLLALLGFGSIG